MCIHTSYEDEEDDEEEDILLFTLLLHNIWSERLFLLFILVLE